MAVGGFGTLSVPLIHRVERKFLVIGSTVAMAVVAVDIAVLGPRTSGRSVETINPR